MAGQQRDHVVFHTAQIISLHKQLFSHYMPSFEHHVLVCINERPADAPRPSCAGRGSRELKEVFKTAIKTAGLKGRVRVQEVSCLDQCEHAAVAVVYPDNVWYGFRTHPRDCEEIVQQHSCRRPVPVARLQLPETCINTSDCPHRKPQ